MGPQDDDAQLILQNARTAPIEELFREIRRVDPLRGGLKRAEQERRNALESALHCLLIERFSERLRVERPRRKTVLLRHRGEGSQVTRARLSELDEASRAWVRSQIGEDRREAFGKVTRSIGQSRAGKMAKEAEAAEARGELEEALRLYEQANRHGDYEEELKRLRKRAARNRSQRAVKHVKALLPSEEGLLAWTKLTVPERASIRSPELKRLEEICKATRWREPEAAVAALCALDFEGSLEERRSRLMPHRVFLSRTPYKDAFDELEMQIRARDKARSAPVELSMEDLVLGWEDGLDDAGLAEELGCSEEQIREARARFELTEPPSTIEERIELLVRCGWSHEDAAEHVA